MVSENYQPIPVDPELREIARVYWGHMIELCAAFGWPTDLIKTYSRQAQEFEDFRQAWKEAHNGEDLWEDMLW
jgi:hypothetical protein